MAPLTAAEKQKILLQQEIAKLSGAISRHSSTSTSAASSSYHPYRGRPAPRGSVPTRGGGRGRGRGRGGSYALDLRQINKNTSSSAEPSRPSSSASVIRPGETEEGELRPSSPPTSASNVPSAAVDAGAAGWVKGKGKMGNMSLMTVEKRDQLRSQKQSRPKLPPQIQMVNSSSTSSGDKRVVIDGVMFQFEQDGKKLTRIGEAPSASGSGSTFTPTRKSLNLGGGRYRRTMKGNLILKKTGSPAKSQQLCRYFTKTGRCNFGLTCPHIHDPARVSICPRYLRGSCTLESSCPLSHTPSPHNTPSCLRFQATSSCSVPNCPYPHIKVSSDAPVCEPFARYGWCPKESGKCEDLHVWECPEFRAKGTCAKDGKCGLRHVVRAEKTRKDEGGASKSADGEITIDTIGESVNGFEEQNNFIQFDQGSPGVVISDDEGGEDEEASGSGSESQSDSESGEESDEEMEDDEEEEGGNDDFDVDDDQEAKCFNDESDVRGGEETEDVRVKGGRVPLLTAGKQNLSFGMPPPSPSPASTPYVQSDNMDTDEVDEDAVLSVV